MKHFARRVGIFSVSLLRSLVCYCLSPGEHRLVHNDAPLGYDEVGRASIDDFTIAADNAVFGQAGPRVSSPADGYFVPYLTKVVGAKKARELWMLCRKYKAEQALEMGLVNTVVPLEQLEAEVAKWCEELLSVSPGCLEILKAAFDQELDGYKEPCAISAAMYPDWFDMPEGKEGGAAFVEKRPARFWDIRGREVAMREQLLAEYEALQAKGKAGK